MAPAQPPLPTARNLPFQFSAGIHNSISMYESADGVKVAAMRQCAGNCTPPCAARPVRCDPAGTYSTAVTVVCGIESDFKPSHADCCAAAAKSTRAKLLI